jgi:outer membrane biosynthesis protein TonB
MSDAGHAAHPAEVATADPAVGAEEQPSGARSPEESTVGSEAKQKPLGAVAEETRTIDVIRDVVNKNRDKVRQCFDALSREEKGSGGMLTIAFKIGPNGNVQDASLNAARSTLAQPRLVRCATRAFKSIEFPPSSRGFESTGNYPFKFKP